MTDPTGALDGSPTEAPTELHGAALTISHGQEVLHTTAHGYLTLIKALADDGYTVIVDVCGVDYLSYPGRALPASVAPERFEVVVNLLSMSTARRIRVRCQVPEHAASVPSLYWLFPGTEAMEREAFDMFGITFAGHPDLTRILMPEDWEGHPLRKDYAVGRIPVQFKQGNK
jgi:NADH-quinone oxidoreductase subunit C